MSEETATNQNVAQVTPARAEEAGAPGKPQEQLEVEEAELADEDIVYPTGPKLWLTIGSMCIAQFLHGLDLTIVAVTVPSLTDEFKTLSDIGWYSAAYGLTASSFVFFFGKLYTIFSLKSIFITGLVIFETGSLICTVAPNSAVFILGRAVAGLGASALQGGGFKLLRHCFPLSKLAIMGGMVMSCQSIGLVAAPAVGGGLTDAFGWRACYGINLPLGVICIALTAYGFRDPMPNPDAALPLKDKLKRISVLGTLLVVPAIVCLLMALQWGGAKYGWKDPRIIVLFVLFGVLFSAFGYLQYRQGDDAILPPRIVKNRSILAAMWFSGCYNGILAMTEYYISIYFQGVRGFTPSKSGLLGLPMIGGLAVAGIAGAMGTNKIGYYFPSMFATSILAPIASGLLTTVDLDASVVKVAALLGFLGAAVGFGAQAPQLAVQTVLAPKDVSLGGAVTMFGATMGSALWICASATLFQGRLVDQISQHSPSTNVTTLETVGLSEIREVIGSQKLHGVLSGYNEAVVETLYMPLALGVATILGSVAMERRSIKKKQD
ncbi:hypothetical protein FQN54_004034 [Arachnomyces sp. PD_36]|nr:hypothetical protein FQN54_004034 [Arachnomyces sp. PD_36]